MKILDKLIDKISEVFKEMDTESVNYMMGW